MVEYKEQMKYSILSFTHLSAFYWYMRNVELYLGSEMLSFLFQIFFFKHCSICFLFQIIFASTVWSFDEFMQISSASGAILSASLSSLFLWDARKKSFLWNSIVQCSRCLLCSSPYARNASTLTNVMCFL